MKGGATITITGPTSAPATSSLPSALQSDASLFQYMAIYDASNATAVQFGGNSNINITGNIYAPTAAVTFQGNPTINVGGGKGAANSSPHRSRSMATPPSTTAGARRAIDADRTICVVGAMMRKLDQRGIAALEFCLVAVPLFTLMFVIFDLGRYAITVQSLWALANAEARAIMINCYTTGRNPKAHHPPAAPATICPPRRSKPSPRSCMPPVSHLQ